MATYCQMCFKDNGRHQSDMVSGDGTRVILCPGCRYQVRQVVNWLAYRGVQLEFPDTALAGAREADGEADNNQPGPSDLAQTAPKKPKKGPLGG